MPIKTNWYVAIGQKKVCFDMAQVGALIDFSKLEDELAKGLNMQMQAEFEKLQKELKSVKANFARDTKFAKQDWLFWCIGTPMLAEMIAGGQTSGVVYSKADIEKYFQKFSARYPNETSRLKNLLNVDKANDIKLPKHILEVMRAELDEKGLKQGHGRPKN